MKITVRTLRRGWSTDVDLPDNTPCLVGELRLLAARAADIPPARAKLVLRGAALRDDKQIAPVKPGDTVLVAAAPELPEGGARGPDADQDDDDDPLAGRIDGATLSPTMLRVVRFLQFTCGVPEPVVHLLLRVRSRTWAGMAAWMMAARLSWACDLGPIFVIFTGFACIYFGLGTRQPGEASAYSVFNNFVELPGTYNAAQLEDQLRHRRRED